MKEEHWSEEPELGRGSLRFRFLFYTLSLFGPFVLRFLAVLVSFFFYIAARTKRKYSREFIRNASKFTGRDLSRNCSTIKHFRSFAISLADKMSAWSGKIHLEDIEIKPGDFTELVNHLNMGQGIFALCSHLGNIEVFRALGSINSQITAEFQIIAIVDFEGTSGFNHLLETINSRSMTEIIPVSDIGPDTIIYLKDFALAGGMIVIAGDRTSRTNQNRIIQLPFLNEEADFPYGPFLLADLLELPVYEIFALKDPSAIMKSHYDIHIHKSPVTAGGNRHTRDARLKNMADHYRDSLQKLAAEYPCQWYNFYHFWKG